MALAQPAASCSLTPVTMIPSRLDKKLLERTARLLRVEFNAIARDPDRTQYLCAGGLHRD
jgi:hypothetical protein